ncbi:unnamed protein product [Prorocentrum cordatum]|uniref:Methyltransferase domain-containing protein n=1 Tax=Prorocentrum cordatum TaxID=2364126 RepID=A0ABN9XUE4_9DINO|nr:unnamed protein product [Polarella glacialis]
MLAGLRDGPWDCYIRCEVGCAGGAVLVAGCGTGRWACHFAATFPRASVLGVDVSQPSLDFARERAEHFGLRNARFERADLRSEWAPHEEGQFGLIECGGVLHHLADPEAAWARLVPLLAPGGVMLVSLYSRAARRPLKALRADVLLEIFPASRNEVAGPAGEIDDDALRSFRQGLLARTWATSPDLHALALSPDLHSLARQRLRRSCCANSRLSRDGSRSSLSLKDLQDKLNVNIDDCLATQKTIDELVGKTKTAAPQSEARQAQQAQQAEEEDFPELDAGELASLDEPTRKTHKEASEAHKKARSVLKSATDAGKAAREAAERLRKVHESIKRRRGDDGLVAGADDKTSEVEAQPASKEKVDFTDAAAVEQYIEQTAALRARAVQQDIKKLRYKWWQSQFTWAPATPTGRSTSGTHGGTCWLARAGHVTSAHLPDGAGQSVFQKELRDISIILWRLKGATLVLISVYLECRVGLDDPANIAKMIQLTQVVQMPIQPVKIEINTTTMHKEKGLKRAQRDREKYLKMTDSNDNHGDAAQPGPGQSMTEASENQSWPQDGNPTAVAPTSMGDDFDPFEQMGAEADEPDQVQLQLERRWTARRDFAKQELPVAMRDLELKARLRISNKSTILAQNPKDAREVENVLAELNINIKTDQTMKDLGADNTMGQRSEVRALGVADASATLAQQRLAAVAMELAAQAPRAIRAGFVVPAQAVAVQAQRPRNRGDVFVKGGRRSAGAIAGQIEAELWVIPSGAAAAAGAVRSGPPALDSTRLLSVCCALVPVAECLSARPLPAVPYQACARRGATKGRPHAAAGGSPGVGAAPRGFPRDTFFHPLEHEYDLTEARSPAQRPLVGRSLDRLGLACVGLDADPELVRLFQGAMPGRNMADLNAWHELETIKRMPELFLGMYELILVRR